MSVQVKALVLCLSLPILFDLFIDMIEEEYYAALKLGAATSRSSFSIEESLMLKRELEKARNNLVLSDELHFCYLMTPIFNNSEPPDWMLYVHPFVSLAHSLHPMTAFLYSSYLILYARLPPIRQQIGNAPSLSYVMIFYWLIPLLM